MNESHVFTAGWYEGDTVCHYWETDRALCNPYVKRGALAIAEDRRHCNACRKVMRFRKTSKERSIESSERAKERRRT